MTTQETFDDYLESLNLSSSPYLEEVILSKYRMYKINKAEFGEQFAKSQLDQSMLHENVKSKIVQFNT